MTEREELLADMAARIVAGMLSRPHSNPSRIDGMKCDYGSPEHYALAGVVQARCILEVIEK